MGEYVMKKTLVISLCLLLVASFALARSTEKKVENFQKYTTVTDNDAWRQMGMYSKVLRAPAALDTTFLLDTDFEGGGINCDPMGWTLNDYTQQLDNYWHVDNFSGLPSVHGGMVPLEGSQSMWCGARPDDTHPLLCSYLALPGYGNSWNQSLQTLPLSVTGDVSLSFLLFWDSEVDYDFTYIQWDENDDNWQDLCDGLDGYGNWDTTLVLADSLHSGTVRFRFKFQSDGAWSDLSGGNSDGGCQVDGIQVDDGNGNVLAYEDFEDETVGDHNGDDWYSELAEGYGELAALYQGTELVQEDPCYKNLTCVWSFINGSTSNYGCGTPPHPEQLTVPYENAREQYVDQQIWSPWMDITTSAGTVFNFSYETYWDLQIPNWVFSDYHLRGIDSTEAYPCPSNWFDDGFVNYGDDKTWAVTPRAVGNTVPTGSTHIQVSLDVVDYCQYGFPCATSCHSHSPVYDNVQVYRVSAVGPQFYIRDIDQFQDNFPDDGTITGTARADMASDNNWTEPTQNVVPGDSAIVSVTDPGSGLDVETNGKAAVFIYVSIDGPHSATTPASLICDARYAYIGDEAWGSRTWHKFQADTCYNSEGIITYDDYNFDFCDDLFVPGDTIWYFWGARNTLDQYAYCTAALATAGNQTTDGNEAAANADEFQILPAVGRDVADGGLGGDILYVDGMNFRGAQPYFDTAFQNLGVLETVDRYDIRGPSSAISNHPGNRVKSAVDQLVPIYKKIIWNCGNLDVAFADGTGDNTDKSDDTGMLYAFLDNLESKGGVYLDGDNVATEWLQMSASSALDLKNVFMGFDVTAANHQPVVGYNPWGIGVAGGAFDGDSLVVEGGCPTPNTFDVLDNPGADCVVEMNYHDWRPDSTFAPAIVSEVSVATDTVSFMLSGFSFHYIRDLKPSPYPARYKHMQHILNYLSNIVDEPTGSDTPSLTRNNLEQNVPNPFNPTTTIKYEVKESGLVSLRIYNVAGQLVKTLVDGQRTAGQVYEATWNGLNNGGQPVSSGVYFYKLVAKNFTQTKKMVLLK
jgi:hypothetical protein